MAKVTIIQPHELPPDEARKKLDELIGLSVTEDNVEVRIDMPGLSAMLAQGVKAMIQSELSKRFK